MANENNLISLGARSESERKAIASRGGKASGKRRREKRTIAQALRAILDQPSAKGSKDTRLDSIVASVVNKLYKSPDIKDLKILAEILGELKQTISAEGLTLNINASDEGKGNIERLLEDE